MGHDMGDKVYKEIKQGRTTGGVLLSLAISACVTLLAAECSRSHVQETVTVTPRAAATPTQATNSTTATKSAPPAVDAETEAAGTPRTRHRCFEGQHRDEALYYMTSDARDSRATQPRRREREFKFDSRTPHERLAGT